MFKVIVAVVIVLILAFLVLLMVSMAKAAGEADEDSEEWFRRMEAERLAREKGAPASDMVHRGAVPETTLPRREGLRLVSGDNE